VEDFPIWDPETRRRRCRGQTSGKFSGSARQEGRHGSRSLASLGSLRASGNPTTDHLPCPSSQSSWPKSERAPCKNNSNGFRLIRLFCLNNPLLLFLLLSTSQRSNFSQSATTATMTSSLDQLKATGTVRPPKPPNTQTLKGLCQTNTSTDRRLRL